VALGEHVDVRVGHSLAVELACPLGKSAIAVSVLLHEEPERFAKRAAAVGGHSANLDLP
jgi:hypothetical protein